MPVRLKSRDRIVHHRAYYGKEAVKLRSFRSGVRATIKRLFRKVKRFQLDELCPLSFPTRVDGQ